MSCRDETGADLGLHPGQTIADVIVRLDLMHQLDGFFFQDPGAMVDSFVHMCDEEMGEIRDR